MKLKVEGEGETFFIEEALDGASGKATVRPTRSTGTSALKSTRLAKCGSMGAGFVPARSLGGARSELGSADCTANSSTRRSGRHPYRNCSFRP